MPIQDSWLWQMDAKMPVTDTTHATFWRRLVRWLVDGVPDQVNVTTTHDRVEPGEAIKLTAEVLDTAYVEVNDSRVVAHVTSPSGKTSDVPLEWTVEHDGEYRGELRARRSRASTRSSRHGRRASDKTLGVHRACTSARRPATPSTSTRAMRAPLLKRIAEETGGRFFTPANARRCPKPSATAAAASRSSKSASCGTCRSLLVLLIALIGRRVGLPPRREGWRDVANRRLSRRALRSCVRVFVLPHVCAAARPGDSSARHHRRLGRRGAREAVSQLGDDVHRRAEEERRRAGREHHLSRREARARPARIAGRSTKEGIEKAFADLAANAHAERRGLRPAHRPRQLRRHDGGVQPARPGLHARPTARRCSRSSPTQRVVFVNTTSSSGAFLPRSPRPGRDHRHRHEDRRRAATRRASRSSSSKRSTTTPPTAIATAASRSRSVRVREGARSSRRLQQKAARSSPSTRRSTTAARASWRRRCS